jgi:hypothetical protein
VVRGLLEECGSRRFVTELAADYVRGARRALEQLGLSLEALDVLGVLPVRDGEQAA